jgi:predicted small secreted protein
MIRRSSTTVLALLAALASACATARGAGVDEGDASLADPVARIPIYWAGTAPECGVQPVRAVSARTRSGLRQAAASLGADAVVNGRVSTQTAGFAQPRGGGPRPVLVNVYSGLAVRRAAKCLP